MIKQDNLFVGKEARDKLMNGVKKASEAVGATLGTSGSNSLISCIERPGHFSTNDGATILGSIKFSDPLEEMGRTILLEAVSRANKASGDGSSTTCVLTSAILEEGMNHIGETSPMDIKKSLEDCIPLIEKSIKEQTKQISVDEVAQVASISAEDEEIGNRIQEIYQKIGKEGIIDWDISKTTEDSYTIGTGLTIHGATYVSPYMCDVAPDGRFLNGIKWNNVKILLCRQKITSNEDLNGLMSSLFQKDIKELIIFCDEIEAPIIANLIKTRIERGFKTMVIKMPVLWQDEWWEDLSLATGAKIVSLASGLSLRESKEEDLGTVEHLTVNKEDTFIDGIKDMMLHIANLQAEGSDASKLRAARLNLKTARYFVGAQSESALAYRRLKVEDSINAASCALDNGVVIGGGVALLNAGTYLSRNNIGGKILQQALQTPIKLIVKNSGKNIEEIGEVGDIFGYNSKTGKVEDLMKAGVVDPASVVLNAIKNAIGVAAMILTIGNVILLPKEEVFSPYNPNQ